jgi:uncharacterized protein YjdB
MLSSGTWLGSGADGPAAPVLDKLVKASREGGKSEQLEMVRQAMADLNGLIEKTADGPTKEALKRAYASAVTEQKKISAEKSGIELASGDNTPEQIKRAIKEIINYNYRTNQWMTNPTETGDSTIKRFVRTYLLSTIITADNDLSTYVYSAKATDTLKFYNANRGVFLPCDVTGIQGNQKGRLALSTQLFDCALASYNKTFPAKPTAAVARDDRFQTKLISKRTSPITDDDYIEFLYYSLKKLFPGLGPDMPEVEIDSISTALIEYSKRLNVAAYPDNANKAAWVAAAKAVVDRTRELIAAPPDQKDTINASLSPLIVARDEAYRAYQAPAPAPAPGPPGRTPITADDIVVNGVFKRADVEIRITYVTGDIVYGLERTATNVISAFSNTKEFIVREANAAGTEWTTVTDAAEEDAIRNRVMYTLTVAGADSVAIGDNTTFTVTSVPELPPGLAATWTTENDNVTIDATTGLITGVTAGPSVIIATIPTVGIEASKTITVTAPAPAPAPPGPPPPSPPPGADVPPNPSPAGPVTADNKEAVKAAFAAHQYYKNSANAIVHIIAVNADNVTIERFDSSGIKRMTPAAPTGRGTETKEQIASLLIANKYSSIPYSEVAPTWGWAQVGGNRKYRKTRNRKTNLRRKTGKRSKPSRPSPPSSQQLF